ncbi:MAG: hypothetical protein ABH883_02210 [Candidatus Omnitrophota bacterium]
MVRYVSCVLIFLLILLPARCMALEGAVEEKTTAEAEQPETVEEIDALLACDAADPEKARLLFLKARLLHKAPVDEKRLKEAGESILQALSLDSANEEYPKYLFMVYEQVWKKREWRSKGLRDLKERIRNAAGRTCNNGSFDFLMGPFEARDSLQRLNAAGIILSRAEGLEKDKIISYSTEYGWFELKGSYAYYELYEADINNDGKNEYVLVVSDGSPESVEIRAVYAADENRITDIYPGAGEIVNGLIKGWIERGSGLGDYSGYRGIEVLIKKENGKIYFTRGFIPLNSMGEDSGYQVSYCTFLWDKKGVVLVNGYTEEAGDE